MNWYKFIEGFGSDYIIYNYGAVMSMKRKLPKTISQHKDSNGYLQVSLLKEGKVKHVAVHRLVAMHFVNNPDLKPQVNHKDGNKTNNHFENLEWCTNRENCTHKFINKKVSSKYVGVSFENFTKKWKSCIQINGKVINLGRYKTETEASEVYQSKLKEISL